MTKRERQHRYDISTGHRLGAMRRHCLAWLGLLLIAFNILAGTALPVRAETAPLSLAQTDDRIEVCTSAGMVVLDRDGNVLPSDGATQGSSLCSFCLPLVHGGTNVADAVGLPVPAPPPAARPLQPTALSPFGPADLSWSAPPRAPPFS